MRSRISSQSALTVIAILAVALLILLGGPDAKADVVYTQSCANGQCGIQSAPQALLAPLLVSPTVQSVQTASCSTGSCGAQSASYSQTVTYSSARPGLFRRLFSRGSARSCK